MPASKILRYKITNKYCLINRENKKFPLLVKFVHVIKVKINFNVIFYNKIKRAHHKMTWQCTEQMLKTMTFAFPLRN